MLSGKVRSSSNTWWQDLRYWQNSITHMLARLLTEQHHFVDSLAWRPEHTEKKVAAFARAIRIICACALSVKTWPPILWYSKLKESLRSLTDVLEKTLQIFWPSLPAEYVTAFSGRNKAPKVRCDLTDTHTNTHTDRPNYSNPRCACAPRVKNVMLHSTGRGFGTSRIEWRVVYSIPQVWYKRTTF